MIAVHGSFRMPRTQVQEEEKGEEGEEGEEKGKEKLGRTKNKVS